MDNENFDPNKHPGVITARFFLMIIEFCVIAFMVYMIFDLSYFKSLLIVVFSFVVKFIFDSLTPRRYF